MYRAIFICSGNLCRSPMAQFLFQHHAREAGLQAMSISMGTLQLFGRQPPPEIIEVMRDIGLDLSGHRSQGLHRQLLLRADGIFAMESHHIEALAQVDPDLRGRVALLSNYDDDSGEIADPMGLELAAYSASRDRIDAATRRLVESVVRLSGASSS